MNKLIIFDLDGVLVDSRDLHYFALNDALRLISNKYLITRDEHSSRYDGLNTYRKLELLTQDKGLDPKFYNEIWQNKQSATLELIKQLKSSLALQELLSKIKKNGYKIAVASNSIRDTVKFALLRLGIFEYIDYYVSNEDVKYAKPFPEMYWQCMTVLDCLPQNTIIIEDSHIGREGAINSGARLLAVENALEVSDKNFIFKLEKYMNTVNISHNSLPWIDDSMNVLIPMAGAGSRFAQAGYTFPKPLIEVRGKPMIQMVVENLNIKANYIFIVQKEHYDTYNLKYLLNLIAPNCKIVEVDGVTEGAACTTLLAKQFIDNNEPLLIANSDQYIDWNANETMYSLTSDNIDGGMLTFTGSHPKWSYARLDESGYIEEVAEKRVISNIASVGVYYWRHGADYVKYAEQMIDKNIRVNNEFYVAPVINEAIADGKKFKIKNISAMWGTGTPEDLNYFLNNHGK